MARPNPTADCSLNFAMNVSDDRAKTLMTINTGLFVVIALYFFLWGQPPTSNLSDVPTSLYPAHSDRE
jgi:hypothetical protein